MKLWIARDSYGLWLFAHKPIKCITNGDKYFSRQNNIRYSIDSFLFPEITFENSPKKIELNICK